MNPVCYRPFIPICVALVLQVLLCNCVCKLLSTSSASAWFPQVQVGVGFMEDCRQRVADATQEYQEGRIDENEHLCAITGLSNLREGIELKTVAREAGAPCRYLGLGGAGSGSRHLTKVAGTIIDSDLLPDLVILGFGPYQLVEEPERRANEFTPTFFSYLRQGDLRHVALAIRNWLWFFERRPDVRLTAEGALGDARVWLLRQFKVKQWQAQDSHRSPWREMLWQYSDHAEQYSEATMREEIALEEKLGFYDIHTYQNSTKALGLLVRLIQQLRSRGAVVLLLLTPEHSLARARVPAQALEPMQNALRQAFTDNIIPPILDCRDAIDDRGFVDPEHMNAKGRQHLSQLLGKRIPQYLPKHPPLMSHWEASSDHSSRP
jgi:hypothetical protein